MLTIYKYTILPNDKFEIEMPEGAKILTVQIQYDRPRLWALVDPSAKLEKLTFLVRGTGHYIHEKMENLKYINTFQFREGVLVFHLFQVIG
jgi:hypothetical protein